MLKRKKVWMTVSAITLAGAASLTMTGCSSENSEINTQKTMPSLSTKVDSHDVHSNDLATSSEGESYEQGEGEGYEQGEGEGEGADSVNLASDDIAYLAHLAFMRGHLYVGYELYKAKHLDHAKMHMKHPKSELYTDVEPVFAVRGSQGFDKELSALANAVESNASNDVVSDAYADLISAIARNEATVKGKSLLANARLKLVSEILREAASEYAIAVVDGEMQNAHEYQDAYGFTIIAKNIVTTIASESEDVNQVKQSALVLIESLSGHWPSLMPPETLATKANAIYGVAAKIELLSLSIASD